MHWPDRGGARLSSRLLVSFSRDTRWASVNFRSLLVQAHLADQPVSSRRHFTQSPNVARSPSRLIDYLRVKVTRSCYKRLWLLMRSIGRIALIRTTTLVNPPVILLRICWHVILLLSNSCHDRPSYACSSHATFSTYVESATEPKLGLCTFSPPCPFAITVSPHTLRLRRC